MAHTFLQAISMVVREMNMSDSHAQSCARYLMQPTVQVAHTIQHSSQDRALIHMRCARDCMLSTLALFYVELPLLLKTLMQILSLLGFMDMCTSVWQIFELSALIHIREIIYIQEMGYI